MGSARTKQINQLSPSPPFALALSAMLVSLTFGGGTFQWLPSEFICQGLGVVFLAVGLFQVVYSAEVARVRFELGFTAGLLLLPAIQIVPAPPWLWTLLPGRHFLIDEFRAVGLEPLPWQPISLSIDATWQALLSLSLPLSVFLACLLLTFKERRLLSIAVMVTGGGSIVLALMQQLGGTESSLRFYALTNESLPVGLFANRNHFAAFLCCTLPINVAWATAAGAKLTPSRRSRQTDPKHVVAFLAFAILFVALLLTEGLIHSRAGLLVTILALGLSSSLTITRQRSELGRQVRILLLGLLSIASILIGYYALSSIIQSFDNDPIEDLRFTILKGSLQAMRAFFPVGAGFGTFDVVYQRFEQPVNATSDYINRAHNDIIESVLEGGILTIAVLGFFFVWLALRTWSVWTLPAFREASMIDAALARGAAFIPLLLAVHSLVDYPLRTEAIMSFVALACAFLVPPANEDKDRSCRTKPRRQKVRCSSAERIASQSRQVA